MTLVENYTTGNVPDELRAEIESQVRAENRTLVESDFPIAAVWGEEGWEIMFSVGLHWKSMRKMRQMMNLT